MSFPCTLQELETMLTELPKSLIRIGLKNKITETNIRSTVETAIKHDSPKTVNEYKYIYCYYIKKVKKIM